jgi:TPP-dependent pyruvate/acetoin dehydrogenase alpha subunit
VAVAFFGDGAANTGSVHEAMNLAGIWKLPVIFLCENNCFGMFTPMACSTPITDIAQRAAAYGMPGVAIDGNDVIEVYETALAAVNKARQGEGPSLIECKTYRHFHHYQGDKGRYRDPAELEEWKKLDPIARLKKKLMEDGALDEETDRQIAAEAKQEADEATEYAISSPEPELSELMTGLYVDFKPV